MFFIRRERQQRYGNVANTDTSDSEHEASNDAHAVFYQTLHKIQSQQRISPVNTWTWIWIRATPILATASWLGTLVLLLFAWIFEDEMIRYPISNVAIPSVSEVVSYHKTITLFGAISTGVFLIQSLEQERFLRFKRVLVEAREERWLWISVGLLDCILGACASVALMLIPIFDSMEFPRLHKLFKASFFVFIALCGLLNCVEVEHLWHEHPDRHDLRAGTFLKYNFLWLFISCGTTSQLLYGFCHSSRIDVEYQLCYRTTTASSILEWTSCLSLTGFLATLALDVWPISRAIPVHPRFSASSQGLSHVHHEHSDGEDRIEIPKGVEVRRLPMMSRPGIVGYGNGWTDRKEKGEEEDHEFAWYEMRVLQQ
ncbi:hypothetical protein JCM3765_005298 [Sporobolomyces pararoseus]